MRRMVINWGRGDLMKVVIMESLAVSEEKLLSLKKPFEDSGVAFFDYEKTTSIEKMVSQAKDADIMMIANMPIPSEVIEKCENLKFINVAFTGVNHLDLDACMKKNISVSNASGYSNESVAELGVGMAISMLRNMVQVEERLRSLQTKDGLVGNEIKGKTVGIVGLGKIGSRSAELFHAFGAKILSSSRTVHENEPDYIQQVSLDDLLKKSDIVILHCPLNSETKHLIDKKKLELMKETAILINLARGEVVNEADLSEALEKGVIRGACVDVFSTEPPLSGDEPILKAPNTLLTPHIAFASEESMDLRAEIVFDNLKAWIDGKQKNVVL